MEKLSHSCCKQENVKVYADLTPGKKDGEELIKDPSGNLVLNIKDGKKKGKSPLRLLLTQVQRRTQILWRLKYA